MGYTCAHLLAAFVVTALWDVALRVLSTATHLHVPFVSDWKWVKVLRPYFQRHTLLSAALIAGFTGAVAYTLIAHSWPLVEEPVGGVLAQSGPWLITVGYLCYVALLSGLVGLPMRVSGLFPHLVEYYYKPLGFTYSFATDAFSGVVVAVTMMALGTAAKHLDNA